MKPKNSQIIRRFSNYISILIASINHNLHLKLLEILTVVAVQNKESFLLYLSHIETLFNINKYELFSEVIKCLKMGLPLNGEALNLLYPETKSKQKIPSHTIFLVIYRNNGNTSNSYS